MCLPSDFALTVSAVAIRSRLMCKPWSGLPFIDVTPHQATEGFSLNLLAFNYRVNTCTLIQLNNYCREFSDYWELDCLVERRIRNRLECN
jgi:hypothetical protein